MRAGGAELEPQPVDEGPELIPARAEERRGVAEALAATRLDLDLRGDQLAHEVLLELGAAGCRLQLLETVDEVERGRVEERELLLHGDREVGARVERLAGDAELLLGAEALLVAHPPER